jgi:hypothetical protein
LRLVSDRPIVSGMASITIDTEESPWHVDGDSRTVDDGAIMLKPSELTTLKVDELRKSFLAYSELYDTDDGDCRAVVYSGGDEVYFDLEAPVSTISFGLASGKVLVRVEFMAEYPDDEDVNSVREAVRRLILPLVEAREAPLLKLSGDQYYAPLGHVFFTADLEAPTNARTLQELYDVGLTVDALVDAFITQAPTRDTVADLIRGGSAESLVGQPEGNWLDVKSREYDLAEARGKHSLAVEVAAFCNAEDGGIIVFGGSNHDTVAGRRRGDRQGRRSRQGAVHSTPVPPDTQRVGVSVPVRTSCQRDPTAERQGPSPDRHPRAERRIETLPR